MNSQPWVPVTITTNQENRQYFSGTSTPRPHLLNGLYLCYTWEQKKGPGMAAGTGSCYRVPSTLEGGNLRLTSAWLNGASCCQRCSKSAAGTTRHALAMTHSTKRMQASTAKQNLSRQERRGELSASFLSSGPTRTFPGCSFYMRSRPTEAPHGVADAGPLGPNSWAKLTFFHSCLAA